MGCFRYTYILLAGIVILVGMNLIEEKDRSLQLQRLPGMLENTREQMSGMSRFLRQYAKTTGHYPSNDQGLLAVKPLVDACDPYSDSSGPEIRWCRVRDSGILTRWGDPFIYENRRGLDPAKFADSGATLDDRRAYSVRVDNDVYIWSIGAKRAAQTLGVWRPRLVAAGCLVILIALGLVGLFARDSIVSRSRANGAPKRWADGAGSALLGTFLAILIPLFLSPMFVKTCYEGSVVRPRRPELTKEYKALLTKYRNRGVISDSALKKINAAMNHYDDRTSLGR